MRHSNKVGDQAPLVTREALAEAFADFTRAAGILEYSYRELQQEVARLRQELEDKNRHLSDSLRENERIRRHLQNLVESLPCGVALLSSGGKLQLCNPEARRLLEGVQDGVIALAAKLGFPVRTNATWC